MPMVIGHQIVGTRAYTQAEWNRLAKWRKLTAMDGRLYVLTRSLDGGSVYLSYVHILKPYDNKRRSK